MSWTDPVERQSLVYEAMIYGRTSVGHFGEIPSGTIIVDFRRQWMSKLKNVSVQSMKNATSERVTIGTEDKTRPRQSP